MPLPPTPNPDPADDLPDRCQLAILAEVRSVGVSQAGVAELHYYAKSVLADLADVQYPAVVVTLEGEPDQEDEDESDFEDLAVTYSYLVALLDKGFADDPKTRRRYLIWRKRTKTWLENLAAIRATPLVLSTNPVTAQAAECWDVGVRAADPVLREDHPAYGLLKSAFVARCRCKMARVDKV